jgi:hypothetical protein
MEKAKEDITVDIFDAHFQVRVLTSFSSCYLLIDAPLFPPGYLL